MNEILKKINRNFINVDEVKSVSALGEGFINDTFVVKTNKFVILQIISCNVKINRFLQISLQ